MTSRAAMDTGIVARLDALEKAIATLRNQVTRLEARIGGPAGALPAPGAASQASLPLPELPFSEAPVASVTIPSAPAAGVPPELDPARLAEEDPSSR